MRQAAERGGAPLLAIDSLCVSIRGTRILNDVSLGVAAGEILGLVGGSGSGKSMTALAVMRLLPEDAELSGSVHLEDRALTAMSEKELEAVRGRKIGIVFQEPMTALNPLMRIGDQVAETVRLHRSTSPRETMALAQQALDRVGLGGIVDSLNRYPHELSGGQRQRVAIAIATVLSPSLLIADEPTTALDVVAQGQVLDLLREFARERGMGLVFVSHDLAVVSQLTDRIAVMQHGAIVEEMPTRELFQARHPYTRSLLAAARLPAKRTRANAGAPVTVLDVREIVREYPRRRRSFRKRPPPLRAVDRVSLTVHAGETVGLVGESGSGKSSLLHAILALEPPQAGEVRLLGAEFSPAAGAASRRQRRSIQLVMQDPYASFDPRWRVERLIAEPCYALDSPPSGAEIRRRVAAALEQVGLTAADARRLPREFSGGERQWIAIARALVLEPAVIAFDEAVSALDVLVRAQILELLADLAQRLRLAYLFVSHDLDVVRSIADTVYVMRQGRIVEYGAAARVFGSPQHEYTKLLLAATPKLGGAA